jgi:hypothetical protein
MGITWRYSIESPPRCMQLRALLPTIVKAGLPVRQVNGARIISASTWPTAVRLPCSMRSGADAFDLVEGNMAGRYRKSKTPDTSGSFMHENREDPEAPAAHSRGTAGVQTMAKIAFREDSICAALQRGRPSRGNSRKSEPDHSRSSPDNSLNWPLQS